MIAKVMVAGLVLQAASLFAISYVIHYGKRGRQLQETLEIEGLDVPAWL